jgi:uncharacterized protein with NRDE domain
MCTVVLLRRPGHDWPLVLAANRDELAGRPWRAPGRHWPDRPEVVAGLDEAGGGSWLGLNDYGVAAMMLNRRGSLGPAPGKRSRGELVLEALDHADAGAAALALSELNPEAYRPFNMVVADNRDAYWLANRGPAGPGVVEVRPVPAGLSLLASDDLNDPGNPRTAMLARFRAAPAPDPEAGDWSAWEALMASREHDPADGPIGALCVVTGGDYGTRSSSLIALPAPERPDLSPVWRFAPGRPDETAYGALPPAGDAPARRAVN